MKSPLTYKKAAELARLAGQELLAQLPWMTLEPAVIVDMGCGIGEHSIALQQSYPKAEIMAIDIVLPMLQYGKKVFPNASLNWINAEGHCLPFADHSVDLIFTNFFLAWQADLAMIYREWLRILRPNGLLIFNLFGPDTIKEYRQLLKDLWIPGIIDMHDAGDLLLSVGFSDPVLSVDDYTFKYQTHTHLVKELYDSDLLLSMPPDPGALFLHEKNPPSVTFEIITAHAFAPSQSQEKKTRATTIPLNLLREQLANLGKNE